jgi:hypothetical protein
VLYKLLIRDWKALCSNPKRVPIILYRILHDFLQSFQWKLKLKQAAISIYPILSPPFLLILQYLIQRWGARLAQWYTAGLRAGCSGVRVPAGVGNVSLHHTASRPVLGPTQPPIQRVPVALSLGVKRPVCEADHLPPSSAEIKNAWSYTSTLPVRLHRVVLS